MSSQSSFELIYCVYIYSIIFCVCSKKLEIYYKGATPEGIEEGLELLGDGLHYSLLENYLFEIYKYIKSFSHKQ